MTTDLSEMTEKPHLTDQPLRDTVIVHLVSSEILWLSLLLVIITFLAGYGLERHPRLNFDEGYYLQLTKNLVLHGEYALTSPAQGDDWFGLGNSSPTLVLPIALSFKLLGIGVTQARLVLALYLIGAVVAVYLLIRHLYGWPVAVLSAALFIVAGPTGASLGSGTLIGVFSTVWMGRSVLGEVPGLFFLLLGAWGWFHSWHSGSKGWLIAAGLLFGLAFLTKEQFLPIVLLTLGLMCLADRLYYRKLKLQHFAVFLILSGAPLGLWYGYKLFMLGPEAFSRHLVILNQVSQASTWKFQPSSWSGNIAFFYNNAFHVLGMSGILYTLTLGIRRNSDGLKSLFLPILATGFLIWFTFLSIGWLRYAYTGLATATILFAKPLWDLMAGLSLNPKDLWLKMQQGQMGRSVVATAAALIMIVYPLQDLGRQVFFEADLTPQEFAAYVEAQTEEDALIESFEWQIDFLTTRRYHHPPSEVFVQLLRENSDLTYDPLQFDPSYLIDGPYSKGMQLYPVDLLRQCCYQIGSIGNFDLYRVQSNANLKTSIPSPFLTNPEISQSPLPGKPNPEPSAREVSVSTSETPVDTVAPLISVAGYALRFFGTGSDDIDRVKIRLDDPTTTEPGPPADVGASNFTLEWWMRASLADNQASAVECGPNNFNWIYGNIMFDRDRFQQDQNYGVSLVEGRLIFGIGGEGTGTSTFCSTSVVTDEQWHHIALQRRRADGYVWLFVDGRLETEGPGPGGDISYPDDGQPGDFCNGPCVNSDPFLVIAAEKHDAGPEYPSFSGWIDEVRLSNILRYDGNFTRPTAPFQPDEQTAALWHFDEGSGEVTFDAAPAGLSPGYLRVGGPHQGPQWVISDAPLGN